MAKQALGKLLKSEVYCNDDVARDLWNKSLFGTKRGKGGVVFSLLESLYLVERENLVVSSARKTYDFESFFNRCIREDKALRVRYPVYRELRSRGYIVKTALKFGADFRVYNKGVKPGEDHAKWVVYAVSESDVSSWREFAAKNRVAHSTRKKLLIAVVDEDGDVSFFEVGWVRP